MHYQSFLNSFYDRFELSSYPSMQLGSYTRSSLGGLHSLESRVPLIYEAETCTRDTFSGKMLIDDSVTHAYFTDQKTFLSRQQRVKNCGISEMLLLRGLTGDIFKMIPPLNPMI